MDKRRISKGSIRDRRRILPAKVNFGVRKPILKYLVWGEALYTVDIDNV